MNWILVLYFIGIINQDFCKAIDVSGKDFEGIIIPVDCKYFYHGFAKENFTASKDDIFEFERIFQSNIKELNEQWVAKYEVDSTYMIYPILTQYKRHYMGFYDKDHKQRILVQLFDEKRIADWKTFFGAHEDFHTSIISVEYVIEDKELQKLWFD